MLTVMRALTWPRLIGGAVGLIGLGSMMSAVGVYLPLRLFTDAFPVGPEGWLAVLASVVCLALSYPLYRGCDWARRVLFVISLLICVGFTIIFLASVFRRQELFARLTRAGDFVWPLTLAGFLTIALLHPDVIQAFRKRATSDDHQNI